MAILGFSRECTRSTQRCCFVIASAAVLPIYAIYEMHANIMDYRSTLSRSRARARHTHARINLSLNTKQMNGSE